MHSLHMSIKIPFKTSLKTATFFRAWELIVIVNASMFCELIPRIECLLTNAAIEGLRNAQMDCLVLLQKEIKVKFLLTIVAVIFRVVLWVIHAMIVKSCFGFVAFTAHVTAERPHIIRVLITDVIHEGLFESKREIALVTSESSSIQVSLLLMVETATSIAEELVAIFAFLEEFDVWSGCFL